MQHHATLAFAGAAVITVAQLQSMQGVRMWSTMTRTLLPGPARARWRRALLLILPALLLQCTTSRQTPTSEKTAPPVQSGQEGEARLLSNIRQLTFEGRRSGEGYFSADGSMMIFQSEREPDNPFYQIYLMSLETGDTHRVSPGYGKTTCGWIHPSGKKVLFASTHLDPNARAKQKEELDRRAAGTASRYTWDYDEHYDIFESDLNGRHLKNLTHTRGYDAEGSWSPDGKLIVFSSNRYAYSGQLTAHQQEMFERDKSYLLDIYRMNADGTDVRRLTDADGADGGAFFSSDGKKIVWRHFSEDGATAEIFTMNVDGTGKTQVTHLGAMSWAPYFYPSGDYLIFATNLQGFANFELYLVDSAGRSAPVRVTFTDGFDSLPVFSPDGKSLAWTSSRTASKQPQIFVADWNDAEARRLLGLPEQVSPPASALDTSAAAPDLMRTVPSIAAKDLRTYITYLASDALDGRMTGTEGERRATEYVASALQSDGLEPAGANGSFFQPFEFTAGVSLGSGNQLGLDSGKEEWVVDQDWRPLAFSKSGSVEAIEVVFAGYGLVAPADGGLSGYDSYANLDVKGKWVLIFRYLPESAPEEVRSHLSQFSNLRYKAMVARDRGARGLIVVSGPNSNVKDQLIKLSFDASLSGTSIAAISVSDRLAERLLQSSGKSVQELQNALDTGEPVVGFQIPAVRLRATIDVKEEKRTGRNVLARLRSGHDTQPEVIVGAHVDHLGEGFATATLARREEEGMIHYGADDNASGVAGVLEIAQYLVDQKRRGTLRMRRDLVFAIWSGEELGLLGSSHFTQTFGGAATEPTSLGPAIAAYLNMDMIGRLDKKLIMLGVGSSSVWPKEIERRNAAVGLPIVTQNTGYLPTDATSFYVKGVPILSAFTGAHADYHTPRDTADKINYTGTAKIVRLMAAITRSLVVAEKAPDYRAMEKPGAPIGRTNLRAYIGTVPDYAAQVVGVRLTGVAKNGPAERAGVQAGDIVVELAGKKVENIYDYTYALDLVKIGVPVQMSVMRGSERVTVSVTPTARE